MMDFNTLLDEVNKLTLIPILIIGIVTLWNALQACQGMKAKIDELTKEVQRLTKLGN
jgi:hypothetical protein